MNDFLPRSPIETSRLSLILTVNTPAESTAALQEWVTFLNGSGLDYELLLVSEHAGQPVVDLSAPYARARAIAPPQRDGFGAALAIGLREAREPLVFYARCDQRYRPSD